MKALDVFLKITDIPSSLYQVGAMQEWLMKFFKEIFPESTMVKDFAGIRDERDNVNPKFESGNLLVNIPASPGLSDVSPMAIEAHVDTVFEDGVIRPIVLEDKVISDGSTILGADDKAAVAAICAAMQVVNIRPHGPIQIIFSVGKESSMYGMREFDFSKIKAKEILCIDGFSPREIITACAGKIKYRGTFTGKEAHGAEPEKAINAIELAMTSVGNCIMQNLTGQLRMGVIHNVTEIQSHEGPSQYPNNNTIPGTCQISGELRGIDFETLQAVSRKITALMGETTCKKGGLLQFETLVPYQPFQVGGNSTIVNHLQTRNPEIEFKQASSDCSTHSNIFNEKGIESVVIGAGCRNPHTREEYLIISELEEAVEIITNYLTI
jgi:tripeptide aminopeptidase